MATRQDGTEPILAHGSVYLRGPEREDVPLLVTWMNDWRTSRTLGIRAPLSTPLEEAWFERTVADQGKAGYFFVGCLVADDRPIGTIGFMHLDLLNGSAGLGVSVGDPADQGQGYGTDMIRALLRFGFGFLRLERIWLEVFEINPGARALYERIGFVHEGVQRHANFREGRFLDVHQMAILVDEWRASLAPGDASGARDASRT